MGMILVGVRAGAEGDTSPRLALYVIIAAMARSSYDNTAKPVRKRSSATGTLVGVRMQADEIKAIDTWARKQDPPITRPYAIRRLVELGLKAKK